MKSVLLGRQMLQTLTSVRSHMIIFQAAGLIIGITNVDATYDSVNLKSDIGFHVCKSQLKKINESISAITLNSQVKAVRSM
jgi:hypothetical protein